MITHLLPSFALAFALSVGVAAPAAAAWPEKPITVVVPYPAGGFSDIVTRTLTEAVGRQLGQIVVVENRPGASGKIGLDQVRRAPKDGYTIGLALQGPMAILPLTDPNFGIVPLRDFEPITLAVDTFNVLVVSQEKFPTGGLKEFMAALRAKPGKMNYATAGPGTSFHFNSVILNEKLGIDAVHVPYKGEAPALNDVAAGVVDYMLASQGAKAYVDAGRLRPLAVAASQRIAPYRDVPTFKELGIDFTTDGWLGFVAPVGVPAPVIERLQTAFIKAVQMPEVHKALDVMGFKPVGATGAEFRRVIEQTSKRYDDLLRSGKVSLKP